MDSIDFLPEKVRLGRARRQRLIRQGYLLVAFAIALVVLGYYRQGRIKEASAQLAILDESAASLQQQAQRRTTLEEQMQNLMIKKRVEEHLGSRISAQLVLAELQRQMPASISLTSLDLQSQDVSAGDSTSGKHISARATAAGKTDGKKGDAVKRVELVVTGLAPTDVDVANFIGQLSSSPLFEEVNMRYAKNVIIQGRIAREFQASCYVAK